MSPGLPRCNSSKMQDMVQVLFLAALLFINACDLTCGSKQKTTTKCTLTQLGTPAGFKTVGCRTVCTGSDNVKPSFNGFECI
ncbi:hypothetical protein MTO96_044881, partial [Rhipicephalus appendiculatus]